jgi:hypothetical protein
LIRLCGDGAVSTKAKLGSLFYTGKKSTPPAHTQNRALPTHLRTPDAPRWRSRLALDVGEGQKLTRCIDSPVWRWGGVKKGDHGVIILHGKKSTPPAHTQNRALLTHQRTPDAPRWRSRLALCVGEGQKLTRCIDSPVWRWGGFKKGDHGVIILHGKKSTPPAHTQNRALLTHQRTPDAPRWRSRLALCVGEGQKLTRCIDSPVWRWGGVN